MSFEIYLNIKKQNHRIIKKRLYFKYFATVQKQKERVEWSSEAEKQKKRRENPEQHQQNHS